MKFLLILLIIAITSGCTTPGAVNELATSAAKNASLTNSKLDEFSKQSREVARYRAEAISELGARSAAVSADYERFMRTTQSAELLAGSNKKPNQTKAIDELISLSDELSVSYSFSTSKSSRLDEIMKTQEQHPSTKKELDEIAKSLSEIATAKDIESQLKFVLKFFKEVRDDIKKASKSTESLVEALTLSNEEETE